MATNFTDKNISSIDITGTKYNVKSTPFHATEAEWAGGELLRYKPKKGEIVVYDADGNHESPRIKIGDGANPSNSLPFLQDLTEVSLEEIESLFD